MYYCSRNHYLKIPYITRTKTLCDSMDNKKVITRNKKITLTILKEILKKLYKAAKYYL